MCQTIDQETLRQDEAELGLELDHLIYDTCSRAAQGLTNVEDARFIGWLGGVNWTEQTKE